MDHTLKAAGIQQLSFFSPAKVNLFFRVLYKREDGFHEVASLYQAINLCDRLQVALSDEDTFTCDDPSLPLDGTNLVSKALSLFRKKTGDFSCFRIHLEKRIPKEAGVGGGSSNAATALWAFCHLLKKNISIDILQTWGAELGSDVPFFFSLGTAYGTSRGEILQEVKLPAPISFWIAKPKWGLSTAKVFSVHDSLSVSLRNTDPFLDLQGFLGGSDFFYNDLEEAAFLLSPSLKKVKEDLLDMGFHRVVLTGSGSAFFCLDSFGNINYTPKLADVEFFPVKTLQRKEGDWYNL